MKKLLLIPLAALGVTFAQGPLGPGPERLGPGGQPPTFTELKAALGLTDAQITQIQGIQKQTADKVETIVQQIQTKEKSLSDLLAKGTTDAAAAGKLVLEIDALRKQVKTAHEGVTTAAAAVLFADQKTKLKTLDDAAKLQPAIHQAIELGLIIPANQGQVVLQRRAAPGPAAGPQGPGPMGMGLRRGR